MKMLQGGATNTVVTDSNREGAFAEVTPQSTLNGAQTSALINVIQNYKEGTLTREQAVNIISVSIGVSKQNAQELLG